MVQKFGDKTDEPSRVDAVLEAVDAGVASVRTVVPGKIVSYDHSEQKAKVQPLLRDSYKDPDTKERKTKLPPAIPACPVNFPQGGGFSITWPLEKGDRVEIRFASRSLDDWLSYGGDDIEPDDPRRHDLNDAIVDPGIQSFAEALADDRIDQGAIVVGGQEIHLGKADDGTLEFVALATQVQNELSNLWDALNNHTHPGVASGSDTSGPSSTNGSAGSVGSSKVKSE